MTPGKETISVSTVLLLLVDLSACAGRPCGKRLRGIDCHGVVRLLGRSRKMA
jgi:hypothetical protein